MRALEFEVGEAQILGDSLHKEFEICKTLRVAKSSCNFNKSITIVIIQCYCSHVFFQYKLKLINWKEYKEKKKVSQLFFIKLTWHVKFRPSLVQTINGTACYCVVKIIWIWGKMPFFFNYLQKCVENCSSSVRSQRRSRLGEVHFLVD